MAGGLFRPVRVSCLWVICTVSKETKIGWRVICTNSLAEKRGNLCGIIWYELRVVIL